MLNTYLSTLTIFLPTVKKEINTIILAIITIIIIDIIIIIYLFIYLFELINRVRN